MKFLQVWDQETLSDPKQGAHGDCTRACFRTFAQHPMPLLPHPITEEGAWNLDFFDVLEDEYGLIHKVQHVRPGKDYSFLPRVVMAAGPTVRTETNGATHLVVYDRLAGVVLHDPHPSRDGLTQITAFDWLECVN